MKSFLTPDERTELGQKLRPPPTPFGEETERVFGALEFSKRLIAKVEQKFSRHPLWLKSRPIALGSWARGELCACSDLDLLFLGDEESVSQFVSDFQAQGLKIRSRLPQNRFDWSEGVEDFDVVALLNAKTFDDESQRELEQQIKMIEGKGKTYARRLLKSMSLERESRNQRFDSIANFLEPNLKFGPGGLRDLHQALSIFEMFQLGESRSLAHQKQVLDYYLEFWLLLRHKLHLELGSDILSANDQLTLSHWLGYKNIQEFMREVQKGLTRVNFYSDLLFAEVNTRPVKLKAIAQQKLKKPIDCIKALKANQSIVMQSRIRFESSKIFKEAKSSEIETANKHFLSLIRAETSDDITSAFFRSRLIDRFVPDFKKIIGHVQHDQYHRFSVDAHLLQALRELKRIYQKPKILGSLGGVASKLKPKDWQILSWTCLLHDLAKGRSGDHSALGVELAQTYLKKFGVEKSVQTEVLWMIDQHLILSDAAFRKNPSDSSTLRELFQKGVTGERIARLTIFTIVDIRATNPEAWNTWKERLLRQIFNALSAPESSALIQLEKALPSRAEFLESLDPFLLSSIPLRVLTPDLKKFFARKLTLAPEVYQSPTKEIWLRFYDPEDRSGIFLSFAEKLFALKCSINHASITSDSNFGIYDWFQVRTSLTKSQLLKRIALLGASTSSSQFSLDKVKFERVESISESESEIVIAFTGRDQSGLLLKAAVALSEQKLNIKWAKVHTWGRQIQDLFCIDRAGRDVTQVIEALRASVT